MMLGITTHLLLICVLIQYVHCFLPNGVGVITLGAAGTRDHHNITLAALTTMVDQFMTQNPGIYPPDGHDKLKDTNMFKEAINNFVNLVGKADSFLPYSKEPSRHFTAEKFSESNANLIAEREKIVNAIKERNFDQARIFAATLLHTVQDFYSSSNWVEMGNREIKRNLGTSEAFVDYIVANPDEETCDNCEQPTKECFNNIKRTILESKKLTSGYLSKHNVAKPRGKCGYGGTSDNFREQEATGGINKDTNSAEYSPHHHQHSQAADLAVEGTMDILTGIYMAIDNPRYFGEFLGIPSADTLCFVIDTTASMGDEIEGVKEMTIKMTKDQNKSGKNFVLVPVNDPHPGIIYTTDSSTEMVNFLTELQPVGGDDIPEMSMSGMLLAAQNVRYGSTCYVYTDANAKDIELKETVRNIVELRRIKFEFLLTNLGRKKRSIRKNRAIEDDYIEIAEAGGGRIVKVDKDRIQEITKVVEIESELSKVTVALGTLVEKNEFTFPVDSTMKEVFIEVSTISSGINRIILSSPTDAPTKYDTILNASSVVIVKLTNPEMGEWTANVNLYDPKFKYSFRVSCVSSTDFTYTLSSNKGATLESQPIKGVEYFILFQTYGSFQHDSVYAKFISLNGTTLEKLKVNYFSSIFYVKSVLPSQGFYMALTGLDSQRNVFERIIPRVVRTSSINLELVLNPSDTLEVNPNNDISVQVMLENVEESTEGWNIKIFDSSNYLISPHDINLVVQKNTNQTFSLLLHVPGHARPGEISTVSISAVSASNAQVKNFLLFYVSVTPQESDLLLPRCQIINITKSICMEYAKSNPCNSSKWKAIVEVQDLQSGLFTLKPSLKRAGASFTAGPFEQGTNEIIKGEYVSNCCHSNVTIVAVDGNGNVGRCFLQVEVPSVAHKIKLTFILYIFSLFCYGLCIT